MVRHGWGNDSRFWIAAKKAVAAVNINETSRSGTRSRNRGRARLIESRRAAYSPFAEPRGLIREIGQGVVVLALTGTSVGSFLGMLAIATRVLGR